MIVGGMTGGLVLAHGITNHTQTLSFSGYAIYPIVVTVAGVMGGLAPDVDMAGSTAGKFLHKVLRTSLIISAIFLSAIYFLQRTGIEILDRAIDMVVSAQIGFVLGWFSHMVIDTFNYPGTHWLCPVIDKHFNIMRIDSGQRMLKF